MKVRVRMIVLTSGAVFNFYFLICGSDMFYASLLII